MSENLPVLHTYGTSGPAIVVVHGGGVTIGVYRRLAERLADRFTVHLYNRRGRADAAPRKEPYSFEQELGDLHRVLEHTGARNVIGHSAGGYIALDAARRGLPIDRVAVYDAPVNVAGAFPSEWLDAARAAAARGDIPLAMAITGSGLNTQTAAARLPLGLPVALTRAFLRTSIGRMMGGLLATTLDESQQIRLDDAPAEAWSGITADVLLTYGAAGPPYYVTMSNALAGAIPRARVLPIPRSGHDGINRAPARLVEPLADFFAYSIEQYREAEPRS